MDDSLRKYNKWDVSPVASNLLQIDDDEDENEDELEVVADNEDQCMTSNESILAIADDINKLYDHQLVDTSVKEKVLSMKKSLPFDNITSTGIPVYKKKEGEDDHNQFVQIKPGLYNYSQTYSYMALSRH